MSQIDIYCPHCTQKLGMNREKFYASLGKKTQCPTCHKSMTLSQDLFARWREPPKQEKQKSEAPRKEPPKVQPSYQQENTRSNPQSQPTHKQKDTRSKSNFCTKCGHRLGGGKFCEECGHPVGTTTQDKKSEMEKWAEIENKERENRYLLGKAIFILFLIWIALLLVVGVLFVLEGLLSR